MKCTKSVNKRFLTTHSRNYLAVGVVGGGGGFCLTPQPLLTCFLRNDYANKQQWLHYKEVRVYRAINYRP